MCIREWTVNEYFLAKSLPQYSHWKFFWSECIEIQWYFKSPHCLKFLPQNSHLNGFTPECCLMCTWNQSLLSHYYFHSFISQTYPIIKGYHTHTHTRAPSKHLLRKNLFHKLHTDEAFLRDDFSNDKRENFYDWNTFRIPYSANYPFLPCCRVAFKTRNGKRYKIINQTNKMSSERERDIL